MVVDEGEREGVGVKMVRRVGVWAEMKRQLQDSSLVSLSHLFRARTTPRRMLWMVVFSVCLFFAALDTLRLMLYYKEHPVGMTTSVKTSYALPPPAVTVCPLVRISCPRLAHVLITHIRTRHEGNKEDTLPGKTMSGDTSSAASEESTEARESPPATESTATQDSTESSDNTAPKESTASRKTTEHPLYLVFHRVGCCTSLRHRSEVTPEEVTMLGCQLEEEEEEEEEKSQGKPSKPPDHLTTINDIHSLMASLGSVVLPLKRTIVACYIGEEDCNSHVHPTPLLMSRACHTVMHQLTQARDSSPPIPVIPYPGSSGGLTLFLAAGELEVEDEIQEVEGLVETLGYVVEVHHRQVPPSPRDLGFLVSPGSYTRVAVSARMEHRLPAPYPSACTDNWYETDFAPLLWTGTHYTTSLELYTTLECFSMCAQWRLMRECGCMEHRFRVTFNITRGTLSGPVPDKIPLLRRCKGSGDLCYDTVMQQVLNSDNTGCPCGIECRATSFDLQMSSTPLPAEYQGGDGESLGGASGGSGAPGMTVLQVYYNTLQKQVMSEVPKYQTLANLVSDLGGICGAYLGLSIIVGIELVVVVGEALLALIF